MSVFSVLVFTRNFHKDFESIKFNNYILANCHETVTVRNGIVLLLSFVLEILFTLHDLQRRYLTYPHIVLDCIKLTNASTFLKTWFKIQCSFHSKKFHEIHINSIGSKVASHCLISHQQPMAIVAGSLH